MAEDPARIVSPSLRDDDPAVRALESVSPLATLARGYAIATQRDTGALVTDAGDVGEGTDVTIRVHRGRFDATVTGVERND